MTKLHFTAYIEHLTDGEDRTRCGAPWQGWQLNVPRLMRARADGVRPLAPHLKPKERDEVRHCLDCYSGGRT